jgi:hypothetical protein
MPPLDWLLGESVQNHIRAEGVLGRFELGENPVFRQTHALQMLVGRAACLLGVLPDVPGRMFFPPDSFSHWEVYYWQQ